MDVTKSRLYLRAILARFKNKSSTPLQLCFSLWKSGFVRAAFCIGYMFAALAFGFPIFLLALFFLGYPQPAPRDQLGLLVKFVGGLGMLSVFCAYFVGFISIVHDVYVHLKLWVIVAALFFLIFIHSFLSFLPWFLQLKQNVQICILGTLVLVFAAVPNVKELLKKDVSEESSALMRSRGEPRSWIGTIRTWLDNLLSGRWVPNIDERVKEIYHSNENLRSQIESPNPPVDKSLVSIASDFKAWNDATKLFISILVGLAVIFAMFNDERRGPYGEILKIFWVLFLLVPALSCVYMESFRRRCEREWEIIDGSAKAEKEERTKSEKSRLASEETVKSS